MKKFSFAVAITFICIVFLLGIVTIDSYAVANDDEETFFIGQNPDIIGEPYDLATPNVTFLTHDIGEDASSWSKNAYGFGKNENSIIEQIKQKAGDANVFWAGVHNEKKSGVYRYKLEDSTEYLNSEESNRIPSRTNSIFWQEEITFPFKRFVETKYSLGDIVKDGLNYYEWADNFIDGQPMVIPQNARGEYDYFSPPSAGWKLVESFNAKRNHYQFGKIVDFTDYNFYLRRNYSNNINDTANNLKYLAKEEFAKHVIINFECIQSGNGSFQGNDEIYAQFEYVANSISRDLKLSGEQTPKINLIGHGSGAIINTLFTIYYPDFVDSIFSIGAPYSSPNYSMLNNLIPIETNYLKNLFASQGYKDFYNVDLENRWNAKFPVNNNEVRAHAIASGMDMNYLEGLFSQIGIDLYYIKNLLNEYIEVDDDNQIELDDLADSLIEDIFNNYHDFQSYVEIVLNGLNKDKLNNQINEIFNLDRFIDIVYYLCKDEKDNKELFRTIYDKINILNILRKSEQTMIDTLYDNFLLFLQDIEGIELIGIPEKELFLRFLNDDTENLNAREQIFYGMYLEFEAIQENQENINNINDIRIAINFEEETPGLLQPFTKDLLLLLINDLKKHHDEDAYTIAFDDLPSLPIYFHLLDIHIDTQIDLDDIIDDEKRSFLIDLIEHIGPDVFFDYNDKPFLSEMNSIYSSFFNSPDASDISKKIAEQMRNMVKKIKTLEIDEHFEEMDSLILKTQRLADLANYCKEHPVIAGAISEIAFVGFVALTIIDIVIYEHIPLIEPEELFNISYLLYNIQAIENSPFNEDRREYTSLFFRLVNNFLNAITTEKLVIPHDGYSSLNAQSAKDFNNFRVYKKLFTEYNPDSYNTKNLPFNLPHHLQTTDQEIIQYIVDNIVVNELYSSFILSNLKNNTLEINGYIESEENIDIPSTIHEKTVVRVNKAFYDSLSPNVMTVSYPNSIIEIDPLSIASIGAIEISIASDNPYFFSEIIKDIQGNKLYGAIYRKGENNQRKELIRYIPYTANYYELPFTTEVIPFSTEAIGKYAFADCENLTEIKTQTGVSYSLKKIGHNAFDGCVMLNNFNFTRLLNLEIIESQAFIGCTNLVTVNIAALNSLHTIEREAFAQCGITSIELPQNLEALGKGVFGYCSSLSSIKVKPNNIHYKSIGAADKGVLYSFDETELIAYPTGNVQQSYTIPESVINISDYAFVGAANLQAISFSSNLVKMGWAAFAFCTSLGEIVLPESIREIGAGAFYGCNLTSATFSGKDCPDVSYSAYLDNNEQFKIYVPHLVLLNYKKGLPQYEDIIFSKTVGIAFIKGNGYPTEIKEIPIGAFIKREWFPEEPTRPNYLFLGWYDEPNNNYVPNESIPIGKKYNYNTIWEKTDFTSLYALWSPKIYLIDYNIDYGQVNASDCLYTYNTNKLISYIPEKPGYEFSKWHMSHEFSEETECTKIGDDYYIDSGVFNNAYSALANRIILYPEWTPKEYEITIEGEIYKVNFGYPMTFLETFEPKEEIPGHFINGWLYSEQQVIYTSHINTWNYATNAELVPIWTPIVDIVFLLDKGDNQIQTIKVTFGEAFEDKPELIPSNITGYTFGGYYSEQNGQGIKIYDENMNGIMEENLFSKTNIKIYAYWVPNKYTITLGHNNGTNDNSSIEVEYSKGLPFHQKPVYHGYTLIGYYSANGDCYYNSIMSSQRKWYYPDDGYLEARWIKSKYYINFLNSSLSRIPYTISDEDQEYVLKDDVKDGYKFLGWYDLPVNGIRVNSVTIPANTFSADINLYARWSLETFHIYNSVDNSIMFSIYGDDVSFREFLFNLDKFGNEIGKTIAGASINNKPFIKKISFFDLTKNDYKEGDIVLYDGDLYKCINVNNSCTNPQSCEDWSIIPQYYFYSNVSYKAAQIVKKDGKLYQCLKSCQNKDLNNTEYWQELGDNIGYWAYDYNYLQDATIEPIKILVRDDKILINIRNAPAEFGKEIIGWGKDNKEYVKKVNNYNPLKFDYQENDKVFYKGKIYKYISLQPLTEAVYPDENNNLYWENLVEEFNAEKWYNYGDLVSHENGIYQCIKDSSLYNYGIENTDYWHKLGEQIVSFNIDLDDNDWQQLGEEFNLLNLEYQDISHEPIWQEAGEKLFILFDQVPAQKGEIFTGLEYDNKNYIKMVLNFNPLKLDYSNGDIVDIEGKLHRFVITDDSSYWDEIIIDEYDVSKWYFSGDLIRYNDKIYQCTRNSLYQYSIFDNTYWQQIGEDYGYWNSEFEYISISWQSNENIGIIWEDQYYAIAFYSENEEFLGYYYEEFILEDTIIDEYIINNVPKYYKYGDPLSKIVLEGSIVSYWDNEKKDIEKEGHIYKYVFVQDEQIEFCLYEIDDFSGFINGKGVGVVKLRIRWIPAQYNVTMFVEAGSDDNEEIIVTYLSKYHSIKAVLTDERFSNYTRIRWYDNSEFTGNPITNFTTVRIHEDHILYARLEMQIMVNENNGNDVFPLTVTYGKELPNLEEKPVKLHYVFDGYKIKYTNGVEHICYDKDMNNIYFNKWRNLGKDYILNAIWTPRNYSIYYNIGYWDGEEKMENYDYPDFYNVESDEIILPPLQKLGYDFVEWRIRNNSYATISSIKEMAGYIDLLPRFRGKEINIKLLPDKENTNEYTTASIIIGDRYNNRIEYFPQKPHYDLIGWYYDDINTGITRKMANSDGYGAYSSDFGYWNLRQHDNDENQAELYAQWELKTYYITFDQNVFRTLNIKKGESFPNGFNAPKMDHYNFAGYYYGNIMIYDEHMTPNLVTTEEFFSEIGENNNDNNNFVLTARWEGKEYTVRYYDNIKRSYVFGTYTLNRDYIDNFVLYDATTYFYNDGYVFQGHYVVDESGVFIEVLNIDLLFSHIENNIINIHLKALKLIGVNNSSYSITNNSEVRLDQHANQSEYLFRINSNVAEVSFIGYNEYTTYNNFKILIYDRQTPLTLVLNNLKIRGKINDSVIKAEGERRYSVTIGCKGYVSINGDNKYKENLFLAALDFNNKDLTIRGTTTNASLHVQASGAYWFGGADGSAISGGNGIICRNLNLDITNLKVYGGKGSNGHDGVTLGSYSTYPSLGKATNSWTNRNGSNGQHGKHGKDAGHGGIAIISTGEIQRNAIENSIYVIRGGDGGDGGHGQNGQNGQHGMDGCDGVWLDHTSFATAGGNGGKGGDGGNGGKSGRGGVAVWTKTNHPFEENAVGGKEPEAKEGNDGAQGNGGLRGNGGGKGEGGVTSVLGTKLPDGEDGDPGKPGAPGDFDGENEHELLKPWNVIRIINK